MESLSPISSHGLALAFQFQCFNKVSGICSYPLVGFGSRNINAWPPCENYIAEGKHLRKLQLGLICIGKTCRSSNERKHAAVGRQGWHQHFTMSSKPRAMDPLSCYQPKQRRKPLSAHVMGLRFHRGVYQPGGFYFCSYLGINTL